MSQTGGHLVAHDASSGLSTDEVVATTDKASRILQEVFDLSS